MANKMVERLQSPKVEEESFPILMAATTTAGTDNHEEIRPLRDKFEDRETQIVHELYTMHFPKGIKHPDD